MVAESARKFEALEAQAQRILDLFTRDGYERVAPAIIQPAGVYLDAIGEELRARTYVFTDPEGEELCLRPDLTVPACRLYLERFPAATTRARFCYNGPAFRYQPGGGDAARPREFRQAGIESFHAPDREREEAAVVELTGEALRSSRLKGVRLRMGDLAIVHAVIAGLEMPERWRVRLLRAFWRPEPFRALLKRLCAGGAALPESVPKPLITAIAGLEPAAAEARVAQHLAEAGAAHTGARTLSEITLRLQEMAADATGPPLSGAAALAIEEFMSLRDRPQQVPERLSDLSKAHGLSLTEVITRFERRLGLLDEAGVDLKRSGFAADFGRTFEYYTGFVFQFEVPDLGRAGQIAGGGRYDSLSRAAGAPRDVPAVGAAIHTERLLAVIHGEVP